MNSLEIQIKNISELESAAVQLIRFFDKDKIIVFDAPMGAGKTTLIKQICQALGSKDNFSSPTYSLVNEYVFENGKIFHFDLYRLKHTEELFDLGIEEYLDSGQFCFIEWPEKIIELIDTNYVRIEMTMDENIRYIRATKISI